MDGVVLLYEICQGNKSRQICRSFLVIRNLSSYPILVDGCEFSLPDEVIKVMNSGR